MSKRIGYYMMTKELYESAEVHAYNSLTDQEYAINSNGIGGYAVARPNRCFLRIAITKNNVTMNMYYRCNGSHTVLISVG